MIIFGSDRRFRCLSNRTLLLRIESLFPPWLQDRFCGCELERRFAPRFEPEMFRLSREQLDDIFERLPAMLKVTELVEARTGRRKQHHVTGLSMIERLARCRLQIPGVGEFSGSCKLFCNALGRGTNQVHVFHTTLEHAAERLVRRSLVLTPKDQVDSALE